MSNTFNTPRLQIMRDALSSLVYAAHALRIEDTTCSYMESVNKFRALIAQEEKQLVMVWDISDVQERRPDLTDDQALMVLGHVDRAHDACVGVNWEVLEAAAESLYPEPDQGDDGEGEI